MKICKIPGCNREVRSKGVCIGHYSKMYPCKRKCSVDGCDSLVKARGLCNKHYFRDVRYGDVNFTFQERHGLMSLPEYRVWIGIIRRCTDPNGKFAHRYVNRGIKVCDEWRSSFTKFLSDMGRRPEGRFDIDRIDNDGNYEPGNCRWTTREINSQNSTTAKLSEENVREIRNSKESTKKLAEKFNMTTNAIWAARRGNTWKNIK